MKDIMKLLIKYAKEQFGYDISFKKAQEPDTFESLFGASFVKEKDDEFCFLSEKEKNNIPYTNIIEKVTQLDVIYSEETELYNDLILAA